MRHPSGLSELGSYDNFRVIKWKEEAGIKTPSFFFRSRSCKKEVKRLYYDKLHSTSIEVLGFRKSFVGTKINSPTRTERINGYL